VIFGAYRMLYVFFPERVRGRVALIQAVAGERYGLFLFYFAAASSFSVNV
jgi:hypothetical protein